MTRKLELKIDRCWDCPYNVYQEYCDVGTSFGMNYYCTHPDYPDEDKTLKVQQGRTEHEVHLGIRVFCPLEEVQ